jgi:hypothetical protein
MRDHLAIDTDTTASATVQRRDEHDLVATLERIRPLAFQLPIRIVDEHEDTRSTVRALLGASWTRERRRTRYPPPRTTLDAP